jgi:hypothetical protein
MRARRGLRKQSVISVQPLLEELTSWLEFTTSRKRTRVLVDPEGRGSCTTTTDVDAAIADVLEVHVGGTAAGRSEHVRNLLAG